MNAAEFLTSLWGASPPSHVLVWTWPDKRSFWYTHFDDIGQDLQRHEGKDVYTGVGLAPSTGKTPTSKGRVKENDISGIAGLWADIDVAHPVHKNGNLPPTRECALRALGELPFEPSILVSSGHGLQPWWVFTPPWSFSSSEERDQARTLVQWWHHMVQVTFAKHSWTVDSTFDLSRLLRLPGTWNYKEAPQKVEVIRDTGKRYVREDLLQLIPADFKPTPIGSHRRRRRKGGAENSAQEFTLHADAEPPPLLLETLLESDPRFRMTWDYARADFKDQSPSAYEMSLASTAIRIGLTDQAVIDMLISFRRRHDLASKLRKDYFTLTLAKAKEDTWKGVRDAQQTTKPYQEEDQDLNDRQMVRLTQDQGLDVRVCCRAIQTSNNPPGLFSLPEGRAVCALLGMDVTVCSPTETHFEVIQRVRFIRRSKDGAEHDIAPSGTLMKLVHLALRKSLLTIFEIC